MKKLSQILINDISYRLDEANSEEWFADFIQRTSNFIDIWQKKGNTKYKVDTSKGTIQQTTKEIKLNWIQLRKVLKNSKTYKKCYPNTINFINRDHDTLRNDNLIDKHDWDNVIIQMFVYTPEINYDGENYPLGIAIRPQKKIELIDNYLHIENFETSQLIRNKEIVSKIFENFIDSIRKKFPSYNGITLFAKQPSLYVKYKYHGKSFEETEIKVENEEENNNDNKEKENKQEVNKNEETVQILKLEF